MSTYGERLKIARKHKGLSQGELARLIGIKQPTISELETEGKGSSYTAQFAKILGVSSIWLSEGRGNMLDTAATTSPDRPLFEQNDNGIYLPLLNIRASMGNGAEFKNDDLVIDVLRVTKTWVDKTLRNITAIENLSFIHAIGDSMHPTFNDGDILLVDSGTQNVTSDNIYVLEAHDRLFIKRVRRRLDGDFEISSDNPAVKTVDVLSGNNDVIIKGRVVWVWNGKRV